MPCLLLISRDSVAEPGSGLSAAPGGKRPAEPEAGFQSLLGALVARPEAAAAEERGGGAAEHSLNFETLPDSLADGSESSEPKKERGGDVWVECLGLPAAMAQLAPPDASAQSPASGDVGHDASFPPTASSAGDGLATGPGLPADEARLVFAMDKPAAGEGSGTAAAPFGDGTLLDGMDGVDGVGRPAQGAAVGSTGVSPSSGVSPSQPGSGISPGVDTDPWNVMSVQSDTPAPSEGGTTNSNAAFDAFAEVIRRASSRPPAPALDPKAETADDSARAGAPASVPLASDIPTANAAATSGGAPTADGAAPNQAPAVRAANTTPLAASVDAPRDRNFEAVARKAIELARELRGRVVARPAAREASIRLDPPSLGRVEIQIRIDVENRLRATMSTETPQAFDRLNQHIGELRGALADAGIRFDQFTRHGFENQTAPRGFAGEAFESRQGDGGSNGGGQEGYPTDAETENSPPAAAFGAGTFGRRAWRLDVMA
ncbi:MAG: flagellar hook-length control protein FliK [Candidatus Sumerlaeota bacterium]|nr:flagellar hook-length control protein FliK [Candidatus Sumerlaeota bacterium]